MKRIIDIDEKIEEYIKDYIPIGAGNNVVCYPDEIVRMIQNGTPIPDNMGDFSDGYHTFNQLYHQRAVLFAVIVNEHPKISWKSFKHFDGKYCFDSNGEWFIVGIETPAGSYRYHFEKKYWDLFKCKELEIGKLWDGHTEDDVIRLLSLLPFVSIPDNATNGDVIKAMFPDSWQKEVYCTFAWWNSPYQKGGKE